MVPVMAVKPTTEAGIWDLVNEGSSQMTPAEGPLWDAVRIHPEKWEQHPYGDSQGGFWVVGLFGRRVIWFNDIEDGFNVSSYGRYGLIDDYWCNQDNLEIAIRRIATSIQLGEFGG